MTVRLTGPGTAPAAGTRPRFREGQLLRAGDLDAEQYHRLAARRRHDRGAHHWGIVAGLKLVLTPTADGFLLQPGVAVDGYGRSLVVAASCSIPVTVLDQLQADAVDAWLLWRRSAATPAQPGNFECGPDRHSRWQESTWVRLEPAADPHVEVDGRHPPGVLAGDLEVEPCDSGLLARHPRYGPERPAPDDPELIWPVYLGRLLRSADGTAQEPRLMGRPDAGLTGEAVTSPAGDARLQVGSELPGDRVRFAVDLGVAGGPRTERLVIDARGDVTANGSARLEDDLTLAQSDHTAHGAQLGRRTTPPEAAAPWQLYRTPGGDAAPGVEQLRLEIGNPGDRGDPKRHQLVVGTVASDGIWQPCLTVRSDCTVIVPGLLVVEGLMIVGPAKADPADPRFTEDLVDKWLKSVVSAGVSLDAIFKSALKAEVVAMVPDPPRAGQQLSYTLRVRNTAGIPISALTVVEVITVGGIGARTEVVTSAATLPSEGSLDRARTFDVPTAAAGKPLSITVTAGGIVPFGYPVLVEASRSAGIQS